MSVGIAAARGRPGWDLNDYLARADNALYEAKEHGRDAVWIIRAGDAGPWPAPAPRALDRIPAPR